MSANASTALGHRNIGANGGAYLPASWTTGTEIARRLKRFEATDRDFEGIKFVLQTKLSFH